MSLGFTEQWFALGVLTEEGLSACKAAYRAGPDKNAEHYRYGAFRRYLDQNRPLSAATTEALYDLGVAE